MGLSKTTSLSVSAQVVRTGEPILVSEVDPSALVARTDAPLRAIVQRLNVHSYAVVPIRARGAVIGTLSLLRSRPGVGYTSDDMTMLQDIADRAGLAIENARLYLDLEQRVRERTLELQLMNEQLGSLNEELKAFSYSVAHDLRAPLRSIDGFSRIVLEDFSGLLPVEGVGYLHRVRGSAQRMATLIDDLLALFSVTRVALHRERVNMSAMVGTIVARLREFEPSRTVGVTVEAALSVAADAHLLEIALTNLISNAWKFTSKTTDARIEIGARHDADPTVFYVTDNGIGFAPTQAELLFSVFTRLHADEFAGTGIGLATVQRVVKRHGGKIWALGEPDKGATFWFTLGSSDA
jgi:signal transduction histidine kinase